MNVFRMVPRPTRNSLGRLRDALQGMPEPEREATIDWFIQFVNQRNAERRSHEPLRKRAANIGKPVINLDTDGSREGA
jgi:hypothetical protein